MKPEIFECQKCGFTGSRLVCPSCGAADDPVKPPGNAQETRTGEIQARVCPEPETPPGGEMTATELTARWPGWPRWPPSDDPLKVQVGGAHYKTMAIQPVEFIMANGLGFAEGSVVKYVARWRSKGGVEDLRKARHYLDILIADAEK